ncbi:hypothetical protein CXB51_007046 [Gossypium anomalum]|uniref:Uncharacterized protein n=1 Tax=Gossypium anomalum TaxID=47600 RepID=A0A8J5ZEE0_9ROSI|nr:hypothetical protein CXB51_007046 [Gossypium anomalum]
MEKRFLDKVKDNAAVRIWSEKTQQEKGDSLTEGYEEKGRCLHFEYLWDGYFPKALGHIDDAVLDLFDRLDKRVTPVLKILAETFRSLNAFRRAGEGRLIGRDEISEEKWMVILQSLQDEDIEWRAPWMIPDEILY